MGWRLYSSLEASPQRKGSHLHVVHSQWRQGITEHDNNNTWPHYTDL